MYVGLDLAPAELVLARRACPVHRFILGSAAALPLPTGSVGTVLSSAALQVLSPLDAVLAEVARVLAVGGTAVATMPDGGALTLGDRLRWGRLRLAVREPLRFPNDAVLRDPSDLLAGHGLALLDDTSRRFGLPLPDPAVAAGLIDSLYLPDGGQRDRDRAVAAASRWVGDSIGISVRRLVLRRVRLRE